MAAMHDGPMKGVQIPDAKIGDKTEVKISQMTASELLQRAQNPNNPSRVAAAVYRKSAAGVWLFAGWGVATIGEIDASHQ